MGYSSWRLNVLWVGWLPVCYVHGKLFFILDRPTIGTHVLLDKRSTLAYGCTYLIQADYYYIYPGGAYSHNGFVLETNDFDQEI